MSSLAKIEAKIPENISLIDCLHINHTIIYRYVALWIGLSLLLLILKVTVSENTADTLLKKDFKWLVLHLQ